LLPWLAAADSQPQGGLRAATLRASAHLDFRIVIPRMLALQVNGMHVAPAAAHSPGAPAAAAPTADAALPPADTGAPAQTVAVYGNGRTIALGAIAADDSRSALVLSAAARKAIAQNAVCAPLPARGAARGIVCTASSP